MIRAPSSCPRSPPSLIGWWGSNFGTKWDAARPGNEGSSSGLQATDKMHGGGDLSLLQRRPGGPTDWMGLLLRYIDCTKLPNEQPRSRTAEQFSGQHSSDHGSDSLGARRSWCEQQRLLGRDVGARMQIISRSNIMYLVSGISCDNRQTAVMVYASKGPVQYCLVRGPRALFPDGRSYA